MIEGFFIIFLFLVLGNVVSDFTGHLIPGNVLGMMLLFVSLLCRIVKPHQVKPAADALTKNMALFFVPVGVGLMTTIGVIGDSWAAILVASVVSTVIVIVVTATIQQKMERWKQ